MRTKVTLLLLVLVAGLGTLAYYMKHFTDIDPLNEGKAKQILGSDAINLDYVKIEFRDPASSVVLEKQTSSWEITEPVRWSANFFAVSKLLSQLQFLTSENSFTVPAGAEQPQSLAQYGLSPSEGMVTFGRRGTRHGLQIGKITDNGTNLYVRRDNTDRIFVVKRALRDSLSLPLDQMRSVDIFSPRLDEVSSWNVQLGEAGNLRVFLTREGEKWSLDAAVQTRADKAEVETLLGRLLGLKIESFERDSAIDRNVVGLVTPKFRLKVERSGQPETLLIGAAVPEGAPNRYYAARDEKSSVFIVPIDPNVIEKLKNSQLGLRERRVLEFDPARVQSLTVTAVGQSPVTLQKLENGQWQVVSSGLLTAPGDDEKINALVSELAELRAVSAGGFVTDAPSEEDLDRKFGLSGAAWQVAVTENVGKGAGEPRKQTLLLGKADDANKNQVFAKLAEAKFVYRVDRGIANDLSAKPFEFRSRQLQQLPEGARITSLTLTNLFTKQVAFSAALAAPEQTWEQALASETPERRTAALALVAQLRNLRASAIVAPEFSTTVPGEANARAWTWQLEGTISLEGGANPETRPFSLFLDAYTGGTQLRAGSSDLKLVFTAEQPFIDAFGPLVFKRDDPGPPPPGSDKPGGTQPEPVEKAPAPAPANASATPSTPPPVTAPAPSPAPAPQAGN